MLLALLAGGLGAVSRATSSSAPAIGVPRPAATTPQYEIPCPAGQLPDDGVCLPVSLPRDLLHPALQAPAAPFQPLQGDRPSDYAAYVFPVRTEAPLEVVESTRTDLPHALELRAAPGAPIHALRLEHQQGPTEVVFASQGPPALVITAHPVERDRGRLLYLLVVSDLVEVPDALFESAPHEPLQIEEGSLLGKAGPAGVLLALRQLRRDVKLAEALPDLPPDMAFASDPRNLLPLRR